jgi:hypothetical protein
MKRETILQQASGAIYVYLEAYKLLPEGSQKNILYTTNFMEGLIYRCISDACEMHGIKTDDRFLRSDYITDTAKEQIEQGNTKDLVREHMVPRNVYYTTLVNESKKGILDKDRIFDLLNRYYWTCLVTKAEDKILGKHYKSKMPDDWDGNNIFARYEKVSICGVAENSKRIII